MERLPLAPLRRGHLGHRNPAGLLTLAAIAVLRFVGNVDFDAVRDDLADADWSWVALAFVARPGRREPGDGASVCPLSG
jgi:hypothetical protein